MKADVPEKKTKKKVTYIPKTKSPSKKEVDVKIVLVKTSSLIISFNGSNVQIPRGKYANASIGDTIKIKI